MKSISIRGLRNIVGIPLFIVWATAFSILVANLDRIPHSMDTLRWFYKNSYIIFPVLLLIIAKPAWIKTLMGLAFCGALFGTTMILAPKVPYDAPGSVWVMMISLFTQFLPVIVIFAVYSVAELSVKKIFIKSSHKAAKYSGIVTLIVFIVVSCIIIGLNPILRNIAKNVVGTQLSRKGYIFNAGAYKLKIPSLFVKDFKTTKLTEGHSNKGTMFVASDGKLKYMLELRFFDKEINKEYLNSKKDILRSTIEESYKSYFNRARNLKTYRIEPASYLDYPSLVKIVYECVFTENNNEYVKIGVVIVVHTRIYLDISVMGLRKYYDSGLILSKFNKFMGSLEINGEKK